MMHKNPHYCAVSREIDMSKLPIEVNKYRSEGSV